MIEVTVNTTWQGRVAIRGQYIQEAIKTGQDIMIYHNHGSMKIFRYKLYDLLVAKSGKKVQDKFRKFKPDFLYYFNWNPDVQQGVLI